MLKISKPDLSFVEKSIGSLLAFGKKNKTGFMTGGGVALGWLGVYIFWQESKKAETIIRSQEERLTREAKEHNPDAEPVKLPTKEKVMIYAGCCWPSALVGVGSSFLTLKSHAIDTDTIAKGLLFSQMLKGQNDEKDREIARLKEELPEKKVKRIEREVEEEQVQRIVGSGSVEDTGKGHTLFIDKKTGMAFRSSITEVQRRLYEIRDEMRDRRMELIKRQLRLSDDAYYVSDNPYPNPDDMDIYAEMGLDEFFQKLGCKRRNELGELLELRDYGYSDFLDPNIIMDYKDYIDPETGEAAMCILRLKENSLIWPTIELIEQNPV